MTIILCSLLTTLRNVHCVYRLMNHHSLHCQTVSRIHLEGMQMPQTSTLTPVFVINVSRLGPVTSTVYVQLAPTGFVTRFHSRMSHTNPVSRVSLSFASVERER